MQYEGFVESQQAHDVEQMLYLCWSNVVDNLAYIMPALV